MHCPRCPAFPPHPPHYFVYPEKKKPGLVAFRTCHSRGSSSTLWSYAFTFQFFRVVRFSSLLLFIAPFCWQTKRSVISSQCCLFDFSVCVHHSICFLVVGFITGYSTSFFSVLVEESVCKNRHNCRYSLYVHLCPISE